MSALKRHAILNCIDAPLKILIWTKTELVIFLLPVLLGLLFKQTIMSVIISFLNYKMVKIYQRRFGKDQFQAVCYWFLPHSHQRLPFIPPSYIREYRG